ncbi:MAG: SDR family oxidoreductase, partial [Planctomycetota bacterium]|nr:SDR family oxidoreductase [Planctomycetota bacterium]
SNSTDHNTILGRFAIHCIPAPSLGFALPGVLGAQRLIVIGGPADVADALVKALRKSGVRAEHAAEVPSDADAVVFLGGLADFDREQDAIEVNRAAFAVARALAPRLSTTGGVFVTVQDTGGDFGLSGNSRAWLAGLPALVKTAALEWPSARVRALDLERAGRGAEALAEAIVHELLQGGAEVEVGLTADGLRCTLEAVPEPIENHSVSLPLSIDSVLVVSGGARGVTAAAICALADTLPCRFVLLGRSALMDEPVECKDATDGADLKRCLLQAARDHGEKLTPRQLDARAREVEAAREIRSTLQSIEAAGGQVRYERVDITDGVALGECLDSVREAWGPIHGVIHAAGVLADKFIADKTDEQFEQVFDTKVLGLRALLDATSDDPLTALLLFSSVAARCGNPGQVDYAMGNEVLNKVAALERRRRGDDVVVRALGWGPWDGGMVTPSLRKHFEERGVQLIPLAAGARACVSELAQRGASTEVVIGAGDSAAGFLGHSAGQAVELELQIDPGRFGFLRDHTISGQPVVPMTLALEWMLGAARACRPDLIPVVCRDLQVLRGLRLENFDSAPERLLLRARQLSNGGSVLLGVELYDAEGDSRGAKRYAATVEMQPSLARMTEPVPTHDSLEPWHGDIYGGVLFHGKAFQAVLGIEGVCSDGLVGSLVGTSQLGWSEHGRHSDPGLLDGALQLALLWTEHLLSCASLPTAVDSVHLYRVGPVDEKVRCVLKGSKSSKQRVVCDICLVTASGEPIAELRGVQTHALADSTHSAGVSIRP